MDELDKLHRTGLKFSRNGVEDWYTALIKRFKDVPNEALRKIQKERFTKEDIRSGRDIRLYITTVMRYAKAAEFPEAIQ
jgi:hypothetical protein